MDTNKRIVVKDGLRKVVEGEQLILSVTVDHNSFLNEAHDNSLHYVWSKDGIPFGDEEGDLPWHNFQHPRSYWDRPTIVLHDMKVDDAGIYQCEITNQFGSVSSDPTTVEVLDALNTPLLAKNLVINGEMRSGDEGWQVIEGSNEQYKPYFWSGFKRTGFASTGNMTPSIDKIASATDYAPPHSGDRIMGPWTNRSNSNEVRIMQDIDVSGIADVIDRNIEGITTVDVRMGAWMVGKRFHPNSDYGYVGKSDSGGVDWTRATAAEGTYGTKVNTFWYLRQTFKEDYLFINYSFFDQNNNRLMFVQLENTPNSYMNTLTAFKHRRISMPVGTRKIRVEVVARRDGRRLKDRWTETDGFMHLIETGCWGINLRINVNGIGNNWNKNYRTWSPPSKRYIHPAVINFRYNEESDIDDWWENHVDRSGTKSWITYKQSSWRGMPAWRQYRRGDGTLRLPHKWFNIWRTVADNTPTHDDAWKDTDNYDSDLEGHDKTEKTWHDDHGKHYYDRWFGRPVAAYDAALADLNVKRMHAHWLKDYNNNKMDDQGKSFMPFLFSVPVISGDIENLGNVMLKRRKLILPSGGDIPLIRQDLYLEDLDQIIYEEHAKAGTSNFRPHLNKEGRDANACWDRDGHRSNKERDYYPGANIYRYMFDNITGTGLPHAGDYGSWKEFLEVPRTYNQLKNFYWDMNIWYWYLLDVNDSAANINPNFTDQEVQVWKDDLQERLLVNRIYDMFLLWSGIPAERISPTKAETIMNWVKKRLTQHLLDSAFRAMIRWSEWAKSNDEYKEFIDEGPKERIIESSANLWTAPGELD